MTNLFAYGSLMCSDIMQDVSGLQLDRAQGTLAGYRRFCLKDEDYPAMVPDSGGSVSGVVYFDVTPPAWERLDRFEGDMYARQRVQVNTADGRVVDVATYILLPAFHDRLVRVDWDFDLFLSVGKTRFVRRYGGYRALSDSRTGR